MRVLANTFIGARLSCRCNEANGSGSHVWLRDCYSKRITSHSGCKVSSHLTQALGVCWPPAAGGLYAPY